ncbi:hypothetical protein AYO21_10375 [Fonsecaea monophora]|uniref:SnoaL-like domain-containing protein n=1 Tax=Fonsecaea monophora TaxID=254056 RepID=A0A177ETR0_9EURO|nr:hypothetical protein AYO21_10375 [Fonsecaea monophora]KAH0829518.1 hypothetical protein FOPE_10812 [Fonsecaea pedrosoi]OAG35425.1 hypothetical protein AYO21_10375 [Fonsecaea monophora]
MSTETGTLETLERRLRILEDKDALWTLLCRYCRVVDDHDWKGFGDMFTEDGILNFVDWGPIQGREKIAKATSVEEVFQYQEHSLSNIMFVVDGSDTATATGFLTFIATPDASKREEFAASGGRYEFTFKRTHEGWKVYRHLLTKGWLHGKSVMESVKYAKHPDV